MARMDDEAGTPLPRGIRQEMIQNAMSARLGMLMRLLDPRRDIHGECGYPKGALPVHYYQDLYDEDPIAARVVELYPKETWKRKFEVYENKDPNAITPFEYAWDNLGKQLRGENCFYQDEEGNPIWEYLQRADILSGIGAYGVIFMGFSDGQEPRVPIVGAVGMKLLFMRVYGEALAPVARYDSDPRSPRYGQPIAYNITLNDVTQDGGTTGMPNTTMEVHWSRVVHIADNLQSNEVRGYSRLKQVLRPLLNLVKYYGASAEGYWKACFTSLSLETDPAMGGDVIIDKDDIRNQTENFQNSLQRILVLNGMTAKTLAPDVVDPTPGIDKQIEAICIKLECPVPVFKGYEIGEQASENNDDTWDARMLARGRNYAIPKIIVPVVDRLINVGVLPRPLGYSVDIDNDEKETPVNRAQIAVAQTSAMAQYVSANIESLMTPIDFFTEVIGYDDDTAKSIVDNATLATAQTLDGQGDGSPLLGMVDGITGMTDLFQQAKDGVLGLDTLKQLVMLFYKVDETKANEIIGAGIPGGITQPAAPMAPHHVAPIPPPPAAAPQVPTGNELTEDKVRDMVNDQILKITGAPDAKGE